VLEADTDIVGHINGGHTALPDREIRCICEGCKRGLEIVHNGNERAALFALRTARELGELGRVILGTDAPAGSGVQPLGILRTVALLSALGDSPAETAFCFATATRRGCAISIAVSSKSAAQRDFVLMDRAPAFRRPRPPGQHRTGRSSRHQHDDHRRRGSHGPKPQYAASDQNGRGCGALVPPATASAARPRL
jgi:hypothetical protein